MTTPTITEIITPEMRQEILANAAKFEESINRTFAPYKVVFTAGQSLSKMVKASPLYQAKDKAGQTQFFNEVKSLAKAHKLGERLTIEAIVRNYWVRFNGTLEDKKNPGQIKQINVSLMRPDVKASKLDDNLEATEKVHRLEAEKAQAEAEVKALKDRILEMEIVSQKSAE